MPIPPQAKPNTIREGRSELAQINAWLSDLEQRAQQQGQMLMRAQFLEGFLMDKDDEPEVDEGGTSTSEPIEVL